MWGLYNRRRIYSNFIVCIFAKPWIVSLSCYLVCDTYLRSHRVKYTFIYGVSNFKATNEEALHKDNILLLWTYRKSCIYTSPFSILELILNISYNIYVITRYLHKAYRMSYFKYDISPLKHLSKQIWLRDYKFPIKWVTF